MPDLKLTKSAFKALKKIEKNKRGFCVFLYGFLTKSDFAGKEFKLGINEGFVARKLKLTTTFGHLRIILVAGVVYDIEIIYDVYFKNVKKDLTQKEKKALDIFLLNCDEEGFLDTLIDFDRF